MTKPKTRDADHAAARLEEVARLARRWRDDGDERARAALLARFTPMAHRLAHRYRNPNEPHEDLVQVASVGLLLAIDRFDPERGTSFQSFAIPTILGELKRHFRNSGWAAHVPRGAQELAQSVESISRHFLAETGREPQVSEIAARLGIDEKRVRVGIVAAAAHFSSSLDAPVAGSDDDAASPLGERMGGVDEGYALIESKVALRAALQRLPSRERTAIRLRLGNDIRQIDIAELMGCSQMQVSRLTQRGAHRLRELTDPPIVSERSGPATPSRSPLHDAS